MHARLAGLTLILATPKRKRWGAGAPASTAGRLSPSGESSGYIATRSLRRGIYPLPVRLTLSDVDALEALIRAHRPA